MNISQTYRPVSRPTAPRNKIHASLSSHARQLCVIGRPNQCKNINWGPRKYPSWDLHAIIEPAGSTAGPAFVTWSDKDRELLWEAVPRPLLKLGQAGAQETHVRSLAALLSSHVLVKVQLNGDPSGTTQLAEQLEEGCAASLVHVQGNTILLAQRSKSRADVLAFAKQALEKIRRYHEKRMERPPPNTEDESGGRVARDGGARGGRRGEPEAPRRQQRYPEQGSGEQGRSASSSSSRPQRPPVASSSGASSRKAPEPRIDDLITASMSKGPMTKETLKKDWASLAGEIKKQELYEFKGVGKAPEVASRRKSKAPWKREG